MILNHDYLVNTYVWSILTYGCEAWTICKELLKKIQSFEYWCYRRILKMSWKDKITNEEVLRRMRTDLKLINSIAKREMAF